MSKILINNLNDYEKHCLRDVHNLVDDIIGWVQKEFEQGFELTHSQKEALECIKTLSQGSRVPQ